MSLRSPSRRTENWWCQVVEASRTAVALSRFGAFRLVDAYGPLNGILSFRVILHTSVPLRSRQTGNCLRQSERRRPGSGSSRLGSASAPCPTGPLHGSSSSRRTGDRLHALELHSRCGTSRQAEEQGRVSHILMRATSRGHLSLSRRISRPLCGRE